VTLFLLRLKEKKPPDTVSPLSPSNWGMNARRGSPPSGRSTLITSAPQSASHIVQ
jgi:hypothetical protein